MTWRRAFAVATLLVACAMPGVPAAAAPGPAVRVDPARTGLGATVKVVLTGWPVGSVDVELCGNNAADGSADCALAGAVTVTIPAGGAPAVGQLRVLRPPVGCPCVVIASTPDGSATAHTAIGVNGVPMLAPAQRSGPVAVAIALSVTDVRLDGGGWTSWFGAGATRTVTGLIRNTGTQTVTELPLSLSIGRGAGVDDSITSTVASIPPGQAVPFTARLRVAAPAFGSYRVTGTFAGSPVTFSATFSSYPWGLFGVALLLLLMVGWRVVARLRRRRGTATDTPLDALIRR